jgi:hypothetical protein
MPLTYCVSVEATFRRGIEACFCDGGIIFLHLNTIIDTLADIMPPTAERFGTCHEDFGHWPIEIEESQKLRLV